MFHVLRKHHKPQKENVFSMLFHWSFKVTKKSQPWFPWWHINFYDGIDHERLLQQLGPLPIASSFFLFFTQHQHMIGRLAERKWHLQHMIGYYTTLVSSWVCRRYHWVSLSLLLCFTKPWNCFAGGRPSPCPDNWFRICSYYWNVNLLAIIWL